MPGVDGDDLPLVSIVTPSFNQAAFLEATIQSVLSQDYPRIEYIICDGGSTDGSVEIIRRSADRLAWWCSEPDGGQADAISKGWAMARGTILGWLNSDDTYRPGAIAAQVDFLRRHPAIDVVCGDCDYVDTAGNLLFTATGRECTTRELLRFTTPYQPTVLMRAAAVRRAGPLDPSFHLALDSEYWLRLAAQGARFGYQPVTIATYRLHDHSKTVAQIEPMHADWRRLILRYAEPEMQPALLADARLQTAIKLAQAGRLRQSVRYASYGVASRLTPRLASYLAALAAAQVQPAWYQRAVAAWLGLRRALLPARQSR